MSAERDKTREGYPAMGMALGLAIGAGLGVALGNLALGIGLGITFGLISFGLILGGKRTQSSQMRCHGYWRFRRPAIRAGGYRIAGRTHSANCPDPTRLKDVE